MSGTTDKPSAAEDRARRARIRVPSDLPHGLFGKAMVWWSKRAYGDVLDPGLVMIHNRKVLTASVGYERKIEKWDALDDGLKTLAVLASAASIGCSWCLDFGWFVSHGKGQSLEKLRRVPHWRQSEAFTEIERDVMAYAEAMTVTPPTVSDAMVEGLVARLGVPAVVELTKMVAVENERSRFNLAMGLSSQGFSDRCELPPPDA